MSTSVGQLTAAPAVISLSTARRKSYGARNRISMSVLAGGSSSSSSSISISSSGVIVRAAIRARAGDGKTENGEQAVIVERMELSDGATMFVFGDESDLPQGETETAQAAAVEIETDTQIVQDDTSTTEDHESGSAGTDETPAPLSSEFGAPEESELPAPETGADAEEANESVIEEQATEPSPVEEFKVVPENSESNFVGASESAMKEQVAEPNPIEEHSMTAENLGSSFLGDSSSWVEVGNQSLNGDRANEEESRQRTKYVFNQNTSQDSLPAQPQSFSPSYSGSFTMSSFHTEPSLASGESATTNNYDNDFYSKRFGSID